MYESVLRKTLKEVIRSKKLVENCFQRQKNTIFSKLTFIEKSCLMVLLDKKFKRSATPHIKTHGKKLFNLWKKQSVRCPEAILNISKKRLTLKERNALRFGLNHPILPRKIEKDKMKTNIERLAFRLTNNTETHSVDEETKDEIKFLVKQFVDAGNRICSKRTNRSFHNTLNKLSQDPAIKICRYDKGNGLAILDASDYNTKLNSIVSDKTKFLEIEYDSNKMQHPTITKENSITYYIKQYLKKVQGWEDLIPNGSKPGKLYGMAKVHKPDIPLRPVVSMINTPEYKLAKFLDGLIKPHIPDRFLLHSTEHFIDSLKDVPYSKKDNMVSFDVISLFTNVPLPETIEIIVNYLYEKNKNIMPIERKVFRKLMFIATQGIFMFDGKLYKQIDGVTMRNPLGPILANFFLGHLEKALFENPDNKDELPKLY